jgi:hypothetical protein
MNKLFLLFVLLNCASVNTTYVHSIKDLNEFKIQNIVTKVDTIKSEGSKIYRVYYKIKSSD